MNSSNLQCELFCICLACCYIFLRWTFVAAFEAKSRWSQATPSQKLNTTLYKITTSERISVEIQSFSGSSFNYIFNFPIIFHRKEYHFTMYSLLQRHSYTKLALSSFVISALSQQAKWQWGKNHFNFNLMKNFYNNTVEILIFLS